MMGRSPATLVGSVKGAGAGGTPETVTLPVGTAAGDFVVIVAASLTGSTDMTLGGDSAGAWTTANRSFAKIAYKQLADLESITVDAADSGDAFGYLAVVFRGATTARIKSQATTVASAATTASTTGFSKAADNAGVLTLTGTANAGDGSLSISAPASGFTVIDQKNGASGTNYDVAAAYFADAGLYQDGDAVTWSGFQTLAAGGGPRAVFLLELA
jgi:hypothetical protein